MHNDGADCRQTIESRARYAGSSCTGKYAEGAHDPDVTENQFRFATQSVERTSPWAKLPSSIIAHTVHRSALQRLSRSARWKC